MSTQTVTKIPVVDFSKSVDFWKPGTSSWHSACREVCHALEEFGCFIAILSNKVSLELHNTLFGTLREMFDFPTEIKAQHTYQDKPFAGYSTKNPAYETMFLENVSNPEELQRFSHIFWPNGNHQLRDSLDMHMKLVAELNEVVTRMVFENYGVEKYHNDHIQSTFYGLKLLKYREPKKGESVSLVSHTDKSFSTILCQNHVNGLEVNTKDDQWICVDLPPSSFVFLASDVFQVWSNDRIRSCIHRVVVKENKVRYSFGLSSLKKGITYIPKELVDKDNPLRYKPLDQSEYLKAQLIGTSGPSLTVKAYCMWHLI